MSAELFPDPARRQPSLLVDPVEVENFLMATFGFGIDKVHAVLDAAYARAARATTLSAKSQFGTDFYFGNVEYLRSELAELGYSAKTIHNMEMARHPENVLQIATAQGDKSTGDPTSPHIGTKNPRGPATTSLVDSNETTFAAIRPHRNWDRILTWWMLYRVVDLPDIKARSIRAEFALPVNHSGSQFEWTRRVIIPRLDLGPQGRSATQAPPPADDVNVEVVRREAK